MSRAVGLGIVPVAILAHNIEEALGIPAMLNQAQVMVTRVFGAGATLPSERQYFVALIVITAAVFVLWVLAFWWEALCYVLVVVQATMAVNVLNHLGGAVALHGYAPGVVTAVLVESVVCVVVYRRVKRAGWMSRRQWALLPVLALLLHGPVAIGLAVLVLRA